MIMADYACSCLQDYTYQSTSVENNYLLHACVVEILQDSCLTIYSSSDMEIKWGVSLVYHLAVL